MLPGVILHDISCVLALVTLLPLAPSNNEMPTWASHKRVAALQQSTISKAHPHSKADAKQTPLRCSHTFYICRVSEPANCDNLPLHIDLVFDIRTTGLRIRENICDKVMRHTISCHRYRAVRPQSAARRVSAAAAAASASSLSPRQRKLAAKKRYAASLAPWTAHITTKHLNTS